MFIKIREILASQREKISYLVIGGLTTLVNLIVYFLAREIFLLHYIMSNIIAWIIAVLFAYITNRILVFQSENKNLVLEIFLFVLSRLFSLLLETVLLIIIVELLLVADSIAKIVVAIIVIICNYITGKWIVFKKRRN